MENGRLSVTFTSRLHSYVSFQMHSFNHSREFFRFLFIEMVCILISKFLNVLFVVVVVAIYILYRFIYTIVSRPKNITIFVFFFLQFVSLAASVLIIHFGVKCNRKGPHTHTLLTMYFMQLLNNCISRHRAEAFNALDATASCCTTATGLWRSCR